MRIIVTSFWAEIFLTTRIHFWLYHKLPTGTLRIKIYDKYKNYHTCSWYFLNSGDIACRKAVAIAAMALLCGPPCRPGNTAWLILFSKSYMTFCPAWLTDLTPGDKTHMFMSKTLDPHNNTCHHSLCVFSNSGISIRKH